MFNFGRKKAASGTDGQVPASLKADLLKSDFILNSINSGVIVIGADKSVQMLNPAAARITAWPENEAYGLDFTNVIKLVDDKNNLYDDRVNPFLITLQTGKSAMDNRASIVPRAGPAVAVNISVSPLSNDKNQLTGVVGIIQDVTEQRKEERQRAEFISTASHEMRTPVAAIEGYLALAMNDKVSKVDAKARSYLEKAHLSTKHLGKLFQDLLTSAKAEDGRLANHPVVVEFSEFLQKLTEDLKFSAEKKGLLTEFLVGSQAAQGGSESDHMRVVAPLYYGHVDPDRLREVMTNLFDNAVKYTEQGKITIGLTGNDQIIQFFIRDTGHGIPKTDVPHLFEKFYRVDSSTTRTIGGTGLGLFISRKIIEMYGGRIWVESEPEKGSTFYINLPRLTAERAAQLKKEEAASSPLQDIVSSRTNL